MSLPDSSRVKGAIQIRKLIGLCCIASSVFVFGLAVVIQGAFAGVMIEASWLHFLFAETTLFIGPILLFVGGLEACIPQAGRLRVLPLGSWALLLLYVVGLAWTWVWPSPVSFGVCVGSGSQSAGIYFVENTQSRNDNRCGNSFGAVLSRGQLSSGPDPERAHQSS